MHVLLLPDEIFSGIAWGTETVRQEQIAAARRLDIEPTILTHHLSDLVSAWNYNAPHTVCVAHLVIYFCFTQSSELQGKPNDCWQERMISTPELVLYQKSFIFVLFVNSLNHSSLALSPLFNSLSLVP